MALPGSAHVFNENVHERSLISKRAYGLAIMCRRANSETIISTITEKEAIHVP